MNLAQAESTYLMLLEKKRANPFLMLDPEFRRKLELAAAEWSRLERRQTG